MIDWTPIVAVVAQVVLAGAVSAAVPIAALLYRKAMHRDLSQSQLEAIQRAAQQGANLAYGVIVASGSKLSNVSMKNAALAQGVQHVLASVPEAIFSQGITQQHVAQMVQARFGGLLAIDPAVTIAADLPAPLIGQAEPAPQRAPMPAMIWRDNKP